MDTPNRPIGRDNSDRYSDPSDELPVIVRRSELLNLKVMDRGTMQEVGRVERLWMYPQAHRVLGLIGKAGGLLSKQRWAYKLPQIESLNQNNLWIEGPHSSPSPEQISQLQTLIDHEIWVDGGDRLGVIVDCLFNRKTGQITQYLFVNNRLRRLIDDSSPLNPADILSFGNGRALVSPRAVARLRERPNLRDSFSQMKDQARAEYEQVTNQTQERVRNWGEEALTARERLAEQAARLKQQATERARALQEQASQEILPQITGQAQDLTQRVGKQYQTVQRRAQDFVEDLPPLEQLGEEMRGYGRDYGRDYGSYGRDDDRNDGYRQSPRSRYRREQSQDQYPREPYYREPYPHEQYEQGQYPEEQFRDRIPPAPQPNWNANEPDELTWVDEVEDFTADASPQLRPDNRAPEPIDSRREPYRDEARESSDRPFNRNSDNRQRDRNPAPSPSAPQSAAASNPPQSSPEEPPASRDNPWGYADSATDSDWDDLEFDSPAVAPTETGGEPKNRSESEPMPAIAPEDLEDDDPWI